MNMWSGPDAARVPWRWGSIISTGGARGAGGAVDSSGTTTRARDDRNRLSVEDHSRDAAGMTYVYPVLSRRAGGVSLGVNLNVNNACNWGCVYCQVPGLTRGGPPPIDLARLATEFDALLGAILDGRFADEAGAGAIKLADVAFSGNGEPTAATEFRAAVEVVLGALERRGLRGRLPVRVITNGSLLHRPDVQDAFRRLGEAGGEIWFKVDRATEPALREVNGTALGIDGVRSRLDLCCGLAPTWVQTCWFAIDGAPPSEDEHRAYVDFVAGFAGRIGGVHLYGIARPSMQPQATRLARLEAPALEHLAGLLRQKGLTVFVSP